MPRVKNAKESILDAALDLFSERGYDGTGLREIAGVVGIRESALYKHFAGKQDMLDALAERSDAEYKKAAAALSISDSLSEMTERYKTIPPDEFLEISRGLFLYFAKDERVVKFRKIMSMERFKNEKLGALYRAVYYDNAIAYQAAIFKGLIDAGVFKKADPETAAIQFFAPIFMLLTHCDGQRISEADALEKIESHVLQFRELYLKENAL